MRSKNTSCKVYFLILISWIIFQGCHLSPDQPYYGDRKETHEGPASAGSSVPQKVYEVLDVIRKEHHAPEGYAGGRHFGNYEHHLAERDAAGNTIYYREWDVNEKVEGRNRGAERLITGSDGRAWYTNDHYNTFTEVK